MPLLHAVLLLILLLMTFVTAQVSNNFPPFMVDICNFLGHTIEL